MFTGSYFINEFLVNRIIVDLQ